MAIFEYQATTQSGEFINGRLTAADDETARRELTSRGLTIVDLLWCPTVDDEGTLRDEQIETLSQSIGAAAAGRVPLDVTLAALAEEKDDPRLAKLAQDLAGQLGEGATVDELTAALGRDLPPEIAGVMRAGIESGNLAGTVEHVARQRMNSQRNARKIRAALAYPLLILAILVPLLLFLSMWVIPMFGDLYAEFDLDLPTVTQLLLSASAQLPGLILGLLAIVVALPLAIRFIGGRWLYHRVRCALPLLGRMWTNAGQQEFAAVLATFLDIRLPLPQAIRHTSEVMVDRSVARACRRLQERVESGQALGGSLAQSAYFDRSLVGLVSWGERHGLLPQALRLAESLFADRIEQQASFVRRLLPPVTLLVVVTLMFFVVVGLMVPLVNLIEVLSA